MTTIAENAMNRNESYDGILNRKEDTRKRVLAIRMRKIKIYVKC